MSEDDPYALPTDTTLPPDDDTHPDICPDCERHISGHRTMTDLGVSQQQLKTAREKVRDVL